MNKKNRRCIKKEKVLKICIFILILIVFWNVNLHILKKPKQSMWNVKGLTQIYNNPDYYDIIFCGNSTAVTNISNQILYSDYGVAGITVGEPEQMMYLTYYTMEEALKNQNPKVIIYDIQNLYYTKEHQKNNIGEREDHCVHYSLDEMKNGKTKYNAVKQTIELNNQSNYLNYFCKMYDRHSNWENITKENFSNLNDPYMILGNNLLFGIYEYPNERVETNIKDNDGKKQYLPQINIKYLDKLVELCNQKKIPLVITRSAGDRDWSLGVYNYMSDYAKKKGIIYLDIGEVVDEASIDWNTDTNDGRHLNIVGAYKWTKYLMDYLIKNFDFVDRRVDEKYDRLKKTYDLYKSYLEAMNNKITLLKGINIREYLNRLTSLQNEDNVILIAVKDEASQNLSNAVITKMQRLGLTFDMEGKNRYSYLAIIDVNQVKTEMMSEENLSYIGRLENGDEVEVSSAGYEFGNFASIKINGNEVCQNGRGINFVVYNKSIKQVISSVYFDTYLDSNSSTIRINNGEEQIEIKENQWIKRTVV